VTVEASDLVPDRPVKVILGDEMVASGSADMAGNVQVEFAIPRDSRGGMRLITVGTMDTALTADCSVEVVGVPPRDPNLPPFRR
jgi:hypothetical protein